MPEQPLERRGCYCTSPAAKSPLAQPPPVSNAAVVLALRRLDRPPHGAPPPTTPPAAPETAVSADGLSGVAPGGDAIVASATADVSFAPKKPSDVSDASVASSDQMACELSSDSSELMVALFDYSEAHEQLRAGAYPLPIEAIVELGALSVAIALGEYDPPLHTPRLISRLLPSFLPSRIPPLTNGDKVTFGT